jgi:hypothetical protein
MTSKVATKSTSGKKKSTKMNLDDILNITTLPDPPINTDHEKKQDAAALHVELQDDDSSSADKKQKRRGRKPKDKFNYEDTSADKQGATVETDNNLIIKLPISCIELNREFHLNDTLTYNPAIVEPLPFDSNISDRNYQQLDIERNDNGQGAMVQHKLNQAPVSSQASQRKHTLPPSVTGQHNHQPAINDNLDYYQNKINDLLSDLDDSGSKKQMTQIEILLNKKYKQTKQIDLLHSICMACDGNKWLQNTNVACFWCCHGFDHTPWGVPTKYDASTGVFVLSGIFCSPNCALAHLLEYEHNNMLLWEKVSLLNLLHYKIYMTDENLVPAPDKLCLKMFGGPLAVDEFRALTIKNNKNYYVNFPPCNIVSPVLEETKKIFNQDSFFIPIDKKRINRIQTELKIKRTNSVNKSRNTLDSVMKIQNV